MQNYSKWISPPPEIHFKLFNPQGISWLTLD